MINMKENKILFSTDVFFKEVGVDGIFTDFPDMAVRYLERNSAN